VTSERFAEMLVYAAVSSLSSTQLTPHQKLNVINTLMLGHTKHRRLDNIFTADDFDVDLEPDCCPFSAM